MGDLESDDSSGSEMEECAPVTVNTEQSEQKESQPVAQKAKKEVGQDLSARPLKATQDVLKD